MNLQTGNEIKHIDINDAQQWIMGPDWWVDITGIPGITPGYIYELFGRPDSGKSSTAQFFMVQAQLSDWAVILVDAERKFPYNRYQSMGGDLETLFVVTGDTIEQNFDNLEKIQRAIHEEEPDRKILIIYDSVSVGASQAELEKETLDPQTMADQAKVLKRMLRRQLGLLHSHNAAFVAVNQCYSRIGSPGQQPAGGQGLEFAKAISVQFTRKENQERVAGGQKIKFGIVTNVQVSKNHLMQGESVIKEVLVSITSTENKLHAKKTKASAAALKAMGAENDE